MRRQKRYFTGLPPWKEMQAELKKAEESRERMWREVESKQPEIAKYRKLTFTGVLGDNVAKNSYNNLLRAGVKQPELLECLVGIAVSLPRRGKTPEWLLGSGMTAKQLDNFPSQLEGMAEEIEKLNRHPMFRPDAWVQGRNITEAAKKPFGLWFTRLPLLLRHYAAFIRGHSRHTCHFLKERYRPSPQAQALFGLIKLVRRETGRPMLPDLSNVLTAAGIAGTDHVFDPPSLKVLDYRHRKQRKPTPAG